MDPYLEGPLIWPDVHQELISAFRALLNQLLVPKYVARVEQRVFLLGEDDPGRVMIPDVRVDEGRTEAEMRRPGAAIAAPIVLPDLIDEEMHEPRVEIVTCDAGALVAVIELVSPSNKLPGSAARESFLAKRREVLASAVHWVEIDLLRGGTPTSAFRSGRPAHEYAAYASKYRPGAPRLRLFWPIRLDQPLPTIGVPLRPEDPDAPLDLQAALDAAYDRAQYGYQVNYAAEPEPPLPPDLAAWADRRLRERGLRPAP